MAETHSDFMLWMTTASVTLIPNLSLLVYHIFKTPKKSLSKSLLQILTVSIILTQIIWCFVLMVFVSYPYYKFDAIPCSWRHIISILFFRVIPKTLLYWLLIERLFVVFNDTIYDYSKAKRNTIRLSYLFYTIFCWTLTGPFGESHPQENGECSVVNYPIWTLFLALITDLWISIVILVIFSRKVWLVTLIKIHSELDEISVTSTNTVELSQTSVASQTRKRSVHTQTGLLLGVSRKITLLSMITIISSLIANILGIIVYITIFDNFINAVCVVLMFNVHNKLYQLLCGKCKISNQCLLCCSCNCCCRIIADNEDKENGNEKSSQNNDQKI